MRFRVAAVAFVSTPRHFHGKRAAGRPKDLDALAELEALLDERDSYE